MKKEILDKISYAISLKKNVFLLTNILDNKQLLSIDNSLKKFPKDIDKAEIEKKNFFR